MLGERSGAPAGKDPGRRLVTHWHGSEQPLPTHGCASILHGFTCRLRDPEDLVGLHTTSIKDQQHWEAQLHTWTWGQSTSVPHKHCPNYQPREEERRQLSPQRIWAQPRGFHRSPEHASSPAPAEQEILTGGTGR